MRVSPLPPLRCQLPYTRIHVSVDPQLTLTDDQLCGVGLSVRFKYHLITVWNRDASKQKSIDAIFECVTRELPPDLQPRSENYFYKKHSDHEGFKVPPELRGEVDAKSKSPVQGEAPAAAGAPQVSVQSPQ